jgi:hypothetical protein
MTLRQKYVNILSGVLPAGAVGVSLLLGSTAPSAANQDPAASQASTSDRDRVAERLTAIREAVSTVAEPEGKAGKPEGDRRLAWGNWWNNWGMYRPWGGWGWPNWNNWHNWNNWRNWWNNW